MRAIALILNMSFLLGIFVFVGCEAEQPSINSFNLQSDTIAFDEFTINQNWIGKTLQDVLKDKTISEILIVYAENSSAPRHHLSRLVRELWQSKAVLQPMPEYKGLIGTPVIFIIALKKGDYLKVMFQGDYGWITSQEGSAYFKRK